MLCAVLSMYPEHLKSVVMVKDSKRFADSAGWGYAVHLQPWIRQLHAGRNWLGCGYTCHAR
jgi:hypothetical protein